MPCQNEGFSNNSLSLKLLEKLTEIFMRKSAIKCRIRFAIKLKLFDQNLVIQDK
jgi:hypothetical protein